MIPPLCSIPIYLPRSDGAFRHHGSAITLSFKQRYYLATAAHVNDGKDLIDDLLICTSNDSSSLVPLSRVSESTVMPPSGSRLDDPYDIAIVPLPEREAKKLALLGVHFVGCDGAAMPTIQPGDHLRFIGYPNVSQKLCYLADGTWIEQQPVSVSLSQTSEAEAEKLGFPLSTHIVCRFRHPESFTPGPEHVTPMMPEGMSGGAAWLYSTDRITFAGVVTRWNQDGYLIATRSHFLLPMLEAASQKNV